MKWMPRSVEGWKLSEAKGDTRVTVDGEWVAEWRGKLDG